MSDAQALADLYRREGEKVLIFLTRRTWDAEVALELTAETFALAIGRWRRVGALSVEQQRAWLFTVARRQLSHYLRRARIERRAIERLGLQVPTVSEDDVSEIERAAGLEAMRAALSRELSRLSSDQREAVRLRVVEECSYVVLSERLGVSEQVARARVSRGLRRLADALEPHLDFDGEMRSLGSSPAQEGSSS
jgi:RNA polymerase sigma-70 factor (ECF subfamily)